MRSVTASRKWNGYACFLQLEKCMKQLFLRTVNGIDFYHLGKLETQYKMNERSYCHVRSISTKA